MIGQIILYSVAAVLLAAAALGIFLALRGKGRDDHDDEDHWRD
jgi:hypothetical protein